MSASVATAPSADVGHGHAGAQLLFRCQACQAVLDLLGSPEDGAASEDLSAGTRARGGAGAPPAMDESFMVLPSSSSGDNLETADKTPVPPPSMAESFVVLPSSVSRVSRDDAAGLDARFAALARIFDMASDETRADHPVCLECAAQLREELDARARETEAECDAYRERLAELEREAAAAANGSASRNGADGAADLAAELARAEREEAEALAEAAALDAELDALRAERLELESNSRELDAREAAYWDDFNDFKLALRAHVEERDGLVVNIEQTARQLERLRRTNVFNDAFHIWFDGPFGTVNGFRLGRLPNAPVEWDEINAAWGMACLLLSTMASAAKLTFRHHTLHPLGSFSRVSDARGNSYELFGPVNILSSHKYDRAMTGFLACLKEFAEHAHATDVAAGVEPPFELPYEIDGDKVDGRKIGFPFNRYERWTAALKIMLADLKACLAWLSSQRGR